MKGRCGCKVDFYLMSSNFKNTYVTNSSESAVFRVHCVEVVFGGLDTCFVGFADCVGLRCA